MGFRAGAWATVWEVTEGERSTKVRLTVSRKVDEGVYEQDFGGYCTFIGNAKAKAAKLRAKDRIRLEGVDVSNRYDKEKNKEFVTYKVFDYKTADEARAADGAAPASPAPAPAKKKASPAKKKAVLVDDPDPVEGDADEDDAPF